MLVVDSGVGGLTVVRALRRSAPARPLTYLADFEAFPYGTRQPEELIDRLCRLIAAAMARTPVSLVIIACNTASTIALPALRAQFAVPVVGTVPAIKPAAEASRSGLISVLATPGTVNRDYTRELIRQFAPDCTVKLVGSSRLAGYAEADLAGAPASDDLLRAELAPCFVEKGGERTDQIALACTHFPLLQKRLETLSPWPVRFHDPAPAIARRALSLLGEEPPETARDQPETFLVTGDGPLPGHLKGVAAHFGFPVTASL